MTRRSSETGRTGRGPPVRTQPRAGNERDPCHASGTDAPALRSESPGRYDQEEVFGYIVQQKEHGEMSVCWCECVCRLCMCVHVKSGTCTLARVDSGNLTLGIGDKPEWWRSRKTQTIFYKIIVRLVEAVQSFFYAILSILCTVIDSELFWQ